MAAVRFVELTEDVVRLEPAEGAAVQRSISSDRSAARLAGEVAEQLTTIRRVVPDGVVTYVAPATVRSQQRGEEWDVSIWYVEAIVYGDQLAVERWRTVTYHLVWEHDSWRIDDLDSSAWCYDPFQLYTDGVITSPNILVLGTIGSGKSAAVKTLLYRSIGLLGSPGGQPRWCAILDPKSEYGPLADALCLARFNLHPGGATRLNPLDVGPYISSTDDLRARRTQMVAALAAAVLNRELRPLEDAAVGWAIDTLTIGPARDAQPTLVDVVDLLASPTGDMIDKAQAADARGPAREVMDLRYGLGKLLDGQLRGMFDGPSTERLDWAGRGVVIDLSAVHQEADGAVAGGCKVADGVGDGGVAGPDRPVLAAPHGGLLVPVLGLGR